jgi:hypothetical protein
MTGKLQSPIRPASVESSGSRHLHLPKPEQVLAAAFTTLVLAFNLGGCATALTEFVNKFNPFN